jgi:hypothetical protein
VLNGLVCGLLSLLEPSHIIRIGDESSKSDSKLAGFPSGSQEYSSEQEGSQGSEESSESSEEESKEESISKSQATPTESIDASAQESDSSSENYEGGGK